MNDLLQAVDDLTLPVRIKHLQELRGTDGHLVHDHGHPVVDVVKVELPPRLDQLEAAVVQSMERGGGGSLASTRNVLDADALQQAIVIRDRIREWCQIGHVTATGTTTHLLRAWYTSTLARPLTDADTEFRIGVLRGWKSFIESKLDPQREMDLPWACPICGADTWWDRGSEYRRPLVIRYRPEGPDMVQRARALCRACEHVWGVRELAYAIEHPESINEQETPA